MKFIREIPKDKVTEAQIEGLKQDGFTVKEKEDSVEIWVEEMAVV